MWQWLTNVFRLGLKELNSLRADPVLILLIVYVFSFAVYSVATGAKLEVSNASVAYVDQDRSALTGRILGAILPPEFNPPQEISAGEIESVMNSGKFVFVLSFPPSFEADVLSGHKPQIQLNVDATAMAQAGNGSVFLQQIILAEVAKFVSGDDITTTRLIDLVVRTKFNPNLNSIWFSSVMQIINNITILSVLLTGAALIREREHGTIEHLLVMPVTPSEIMVAKIWANGLVIVVAAILSLWIVVQTVLAVPIAGSIPLFVCGAVLYLASVTGLGILLATFTTSMPQFGLLSLPVLVIMNLLSGSTTPMESMPVWLQNVMQLSPSTHFVSFSQAILYRDAGLDIVWPDMVVMVALSAVFFFIALKRFRVTMATVR
ncbi:ABC transporter permease [Ruegeria pomeroyi]|uniref:Membrane protein, putative n=2 Tax=Ruegeria pomeroyi TaxID=89184 RepID=Q5LWQ6_RUEPO|nr:ABC transporter permease [Ruegeria pomeroyi]HCE71562.1 ABC transporter permease [Ruegeria sp.]AAV93439.1 membrane protein, putative [Ruegeria pomeroyi DSS-3]NVK99069.1 ABC transporter permease [Ruegeria pomeroyi]NVL03926.1 ABC transporter permease [Ruegeria pomeroyi]QWV10734.1 ABC transporter permease [Ruegeria pomeroyi]